MPYFSKQQIRDLAALNIQEEAVSAQIEALDLIQEFERREGFLSACVEMSLSDAAPEWEAKSVSSRPTSVRDSNGNLDIHFQIWFDDHCPAPSEPDARRPFTAAWNRPVGYEDAQHVQAKPAGRAKGSKSLPHRYGDKVLGELLRKHPGTTTKVLFRKFVKEVTSPWFQDLERDGGLIFDKNIDGDLVYSYRNGTGQLTERKYSLETFVKRCSEHRKQHN